MADIANMLGSGEGTENTIDAAAAADASNHQEAPTETGSMSADTAALGGAIGNAQAAGRQEAVTDADGGAR